MSSRYSVVLFHSISSVLRAEKVLRARGIDAKLIPIPRHISSDCGVCLRCESEQAGPVEACLREARVDIQGVHPEQSDPQE